MCEKNIYLQRKDLKNSHNMYESEIFLPFQKDKLLATLYFNDYCSDQFEFSFTVETEPQRRSVAFRNSSGHHHPTEL